MTLQDAAGAVLVVAIVVPTLIILCEELL